ncbi:MAG: proline--tRNA ligase [Candidatus Omnitrophica bacterium]|nr:proline--tRNA ligase [Candidatus Omnitrophota bacterium]
MRWSLAYIPTLRETPTDAEIASHRLMLRAALIRKLSAGTYSYLPLGTRVLLKVIRIVREEMTRAGALEVFLPALQPAELWKRSGRHAQMGPEMIRFKDRHGKEMVLGPTHEEVITDLVSGELRSYRDLPKTLYQIQSKFRDEPRPRFGLIRCSEFLMKDAYSFDRNDAGLEVSYQRMYDAYTRIFERCGLQAVPVEAETGVMGGEDSHEFMVLAPAGEDTVVRCPACSYAASLDRAAVGAPPARAPGAQPAPQPVEPVETPGVSTVEKVSALLKVQPAQLIKTLVYSTDNGLLVALVRGDHEVNESKLRRAAKAGALAMADEPAIRKLTGAPVGFAGPVGLRGARVVADASVLHVVNAVTGANQADRHLKNVNPGRDFKPDLVADIRYAATGDPCVKCAKPLALLPAIEVGHIFKLGTKYSAAMGATFLDEDGKQKPFIMGCYGIGVSRIIPAVIETHHDDNGILWPAGVAPYPAVIIPLNVDQPAQREQAEALYRGAVGAGFEVLLDDREVSGGVKMKDADLIGFPVRILLSEKTLQKSSAEFKLRSETQSALVPLPQALPHLKKLLDTSLSAVR